MNNQPPNHPLYNTLGNPPNILLDSMFTMQPAGAEQAAVALHKPATVVPAQYAYTDMQALAGHPHQAVNLVQTHAVPATVSVNEAPTQVLIYQNAADQQQQQPISYKIPQMETSVAPPINVPTPPVMSHQVQVQGRVQAPQGVVAMEKKKDIVAEAASKIFEDDSAKKATPAAHSATSAATTSAALPTAVKSEPGVATAGPSTSAGPSAIKSAPIVTPRAGPVSRGRGSGRPSNRQHVMPRIQ